MYICELKARDIAKSVLRLAAAGLLLVSAHAWAGSGVVTVRAITTPMRLEAYARVEPVAIL